MKLPKIFHSKLFLIGIGFALLIGALIEYKQYRDRVEIDREIAGLEAEEQRLVETNKQLQQSISFLSSPEYQEKLARVQLNLKKEGEIVVNFPSAAQSETAHDPSANQKSNLVKWWEYVFIN